MSHPLLDLSLSLRRQWISKITTSPLEQECLVKSIEDMRRSLEGEGPTMIECLLVEEVVMCWLQVQHADWIAIINSKKSASLCDKLAAIQSKAHRQYQSSLKTLVQIRKLMHATLR